MECRIFVAHMGTKNLVLCTIHGRAKSRLSLVQGTREISFAFFTGAKIRNYLVHSRREIHSPLRFDVLPKGTKPHSSFVVHGTRETSAQNRREKKVLKYMRGIAIRMSG